MRIAHVIDYFHTDVGYQEYYLAKAMAEAGHEVTVVSSRRRQHTVATAIDDGGFGEQSLQDAGVRICRLPSRQLGHDRAWLAGLEGLLETLKPDVVHCHGPFSPTTVRVARTCHRRRIGLLVDNHIHEQIAPASVSAVGRAVYAAYRAAVGGQLRGRVNEWVANGPYEAAFLEDRLGLPGGAVALVPLGFDPGQFHFDPAAAARVRAERGWGEDTVVAVTGKIHGRKRPDLTAAACESVGRSVGVRLVVAGTLEPGCERLICDAAPALVAQRRVVFEPMLDRVRLAALYNAADVVVFARLPSISIYEASGTGARVVCGADRFADWLAGLHDGIESVALGDLASHLHPLRDRANSARSAGAVFSWPVISADFVARYQAITR